MKVKFILVGILVFYMTGCGKKKEIHIVAGCPEGMSKINNLCVQNIVDDKIMNTENGEKYCEENYSGRLPTPSEMEALAKEKRYLDGRHYTVNIPGRVAYMYDSDLGGFKWENYTNDLNLQMDFVRCVK